MNGDSLKVLYVGSNPPSAVTELGFAVERVDPVPGDAEGFDCLLCPADEVADVHEAAPSLPLVAVVDDETAAPFEAGATDVVGRDAPPAVYEARIDNAVASASLPSVEASLAESETLLKTIFERLPMHLYVKDAEGRHLHVSHAYLEQPEVFPGQRDIDLLDTEHTRQSYADDIQVIETGEPIIDKEEDITVFEDAGWTMKQYLEEFDTVDTPTVTGEWVLTSKVPWYDDEGNVVGLVGVTRDISERKRYQNRLEAQNERLEEFASIVSHDLRNPLNVANGFLTFAAEQCDAPELDRVQDALERMETLIDDVLTLAREGKVVEETAPVDLFDTVSHAWATAGTESATLVVGDLDTIQADENRLRRLLENLFRNAVEHAGPDVTVRVTLTDQGFVVEDDGPGIPPETGDDVFDYGYSKSVDGTGFGLSIVDSIAKAHGWTVSLDASDGGGSTVRLRERRVCRRLSDGLRLLLGAGRSIAL